MMASSPSSTAEGAPTETNLPGIAKTSHKLVLLFFKSHSVQ